MPHPLINCISYSILRGNDVPVSLHGFDVNIHASDQLLNGAEASRKV